MKLNTLANLLILTALAVVVFTFWPVVKEETKYQINQAEKAAKINIPWDSNPPNKDFAIVIPKIEAKAAIIATVDSQEPKVYLPALRRGVAHAKGTVYPNEVGNVFLFAHSTDAFYNVSYYNAVFYLIGKLDPGDEIDIYYQGQKIKYKVYDKKVVEANDTKYFGKIGPGKTLTLQTCYPPGTTLKRLVVLAKQVQ